MIKTKNEITQDVAFLTSALGNDERGPRNKGKGVGQLEALDLRLRSRVVAESVSQPALLCLHQQGGLSSPALASSPSERGVASPALASSPSAAVKGAWPAL